MSAYDHKIESLGFQGFVNTVFGRVATRYDLMNDLMSAGVHRLWKDAAINWLAPSRSTASLLIDVAGGTGDITRRFLRAAGPGSKSVICDISGEMMEEGERRLADEHALGHVRFVQANAESLPFKENTSDFYTISFGIRNVPGIQSALNEAFRVLKPGGRFLCLEFSRVEVPFLELDLQYLFGRRDPCSRPRRRGRCRALPLPRRQYSEVPRAAPFRAHDGNRRIFARAVSELVGRHRRDAFWHQDLADFHVIPETPTPLSGIVKGPASALEKIPDSRKRLPG